MLFLSIVIAVRYRLVVCLDRGIGTGCMCLFIHSEVSDVVKSDVKGLYTHCSVILLDKYGPCLK